MTVFFLPDRLSVFAQFHRNTLIPDFLPVRFMAVMPGEQNPVGQLFRHFIDEILGDRVGERDFPDGLLPENQKPVEHAVVG